MTLRRLVSVLAAGATFVVPLRVYGQDAVHHRNNCRLASQVLRTAHPEPRREWAWSVIASCTDSAGAVLADLWAAPAAEDLAQLWAVSHRTRDARLTRAVLAAAQDISRERRVRITAVRVLATHAVPHVVLRESDLALVQGDSTRSAYVSVDHPDVREGAVPVTPELVAEIRHALETLSQTDGDQSVRDAARAVAWQIPARERH